jgi:hypothetical protein
MSTCVVEPVQLHTARGAWATTCAYAIIYGVGFAFLAGPAISMLGSGGNIAASLSTQFAMVMIAALVMGIGAVTLSFWLGRRMDAQAARKGRAASTVDVAFGTWSVVFAAIVALGFTWIAVGAYGAYTPGIGWAALLGVFLPGALAGVASRSCAPHMAARRRELFSGSVGAIGAVALAVYLASGILSTVPSIPGVPGL